MRSACATAARVVAWLRSSIQLSGVVEGNAGILQPLTAWGAYCTLELFMSRFPLFSALLMVVLACSAVTLGQDHAAPSASTDAGFATDYPTSKPGLFLQGQPWLGMKGEMPVKTKAAHSFAASLSYGIVPAKIVAEYDGVHAAFETGLARPTICICHFFSLPGQPVIVRLHVKKKTRELDGGKMIVYPVVGGSKMADANKSDLIPVDVQQVEEQIWLVRPQVALEPGEYALMLGTQNINIYPFAVIGHP
ncbi:MAG TPA: hypothetical protein VF392_05505 [Terracidiphilus sp.]